MLNTADIRNVKFSKAMGGYKQDEVDALLDKIETDYTQFDRERKEYKLKIDYLNKEMEKLKSSQNSIQNVLLSAQKLADQIVEDAKNQSSQIIENAESSITEITNKEKELSEAFEIKATERKSTLEKELSDMVQTAKIKADSIKAAAEDSVARQQLLYDKIRLEISEFKTSISSKYKEHLELLKEMPDIAPMDPKRVAQIVSAEFDKTPSASDYIKSSGNNDKKESDQNGFKVKDASDQAENINE